MSPEMNIIVTLTDLERANDIIIMLKIALCCIATNIFGQFIVAFLFTFVFNETPSVPYVVNGLTFVFDGLAALLIAGVIQRGRDNSQVIRRILDRALNKASKYDTQV